MITDRLMEESDEASLRSSLEADETHKGTTVDFFKQEGTMTRIYGDSHGSICYARATKSLRVDIQFLDNNDRKRNAKVLTEGFGPLAAAAKASGYTEIVFTTSNPELAAFCEHAFGYEVVPDTFVLRKSI